MNGSDDKDSRHTSTQAPPNQLFSWVKAELKTKPERVHRSLLLLEGAQVLEGLGRVGEAAKAMVAAANSDPLLLPAIWNLLHIFLRRKSLKNVARLRMAEQKAAEQPHEKACALVSWGDLKEDREGDLEAAAKAYAEALEIDPKDRVAMLSLERTAARTGDLGQLAEMLRSQIASTVDERRKALLLLELSRLQESLDRGSPHGATELLREAATIDTEKWYWLGALERHSLRTEQPAPLAEAYEGRAEILAMMATPETAEEASRFGAPKIEDPTEAGVLAASYFRQAARLRERPLGEVDVALDDIRRARALVPDDRLAFEAQLRLLEKIESWEDISAFIAERLTAEPDCEDAALLHLRLADMAVRLGENDRASRHYRLVFETDPEALISIVGLQELLTSTARWEELISLYETTASHHEEESPELAAALFLRAVEVCDRDLSDPLRALKLLDRAVRCSPHPQMCSQLMVSIHSRMGRWDEVAGVLALMAEAAEDDRGAAGYLSELALLQQNQLGNPNSAATTYGRLLERTPGALWALMFQAEIFAASQRWVEAADAYRRMADLDVDDDQAAACSAIAGWLYYCRGEQIDEAQECFRFTLERRPDSPLAAAGLEDLARYSDDSMGLKYLLRERADRATKTREIERLLLALGIEHEKDGEFDDASAIYQELVDRAEDPRSGRLGLIRCARRSQRWEDLAASFDAAELALPQGFDHGVYLLELAETYLDRLGDPAMAEDALQRSRETSPDLLPAVLLLADAARANAAWGELDELLQELLRLAPEAALLVAEERLALAAGTGRDEAAAQVISDVLLENIPEHRPALIWKAMLGCQRGDAQARADGWRRLAAFEGQSPAGAQLRAFASTIELIAGEGAADDGAELPEELHPPFVFTLTEAEDPPAVAAVPVLEKRCELCVDQQVRQFWELELARALESTSQYEKARDIYRRVLNDSPSNVGALEGLKRVSANLSSWFDHATTAEQLAELYRDEAIAAQLWADAGETWAVFIDDPERTEVACRRALALEPAQSEAFGRLLSILKERDDSPALIELLERRIGVVDEPGELVALLVAQAGLYRDAVQHEEAAGCLETALLVDPQNEEALRARAILDVADRRANAAVASLAEWAPAASAQEKRLIHWRRAELLAFELGDPEYATQPLMELVNGGDAHPDTYRRLLQMARRATAWDVAAEAAVKLAELTDDANERITALKAQGWILGVVNQDIPGALAAWQQVAQLRPHDSQAIEALVDLTEPAHRGALMGSLNHQLQAQLKTDPTNVYALRALLKIRQLSGVNDGVFCVLQVLDALGQTNAQEQEELRALSGQVPAQPQRPLSQESLSRLKHPEQSGPAEQLHQLLLPFLFKVYAADVAALKLGRPLKPRGADLLIERLRSSAEVFGIERLSIRRSAEFTLSIVAVPASEPTFAVGSQQGADLTNDVKFVLGRAAWHALAGTSAFAQRTETQIRALHDAALKEVDKTYQPQERRLGVDRLQRDIHRHLPRRSRRPLTELAATLVRLNEEAWLTWCRAVKLSGDRAGLLLAADVKAALYVLIPGWHGADAAQRAQSIPRVQATAVARDLLVYALSDDYLSLRRDVGLATQSW